MVSYQVDQIMDRLEIRDTAVHQTDISDCREFTIATFFIINETDQDATVQIKGNAEATFAGSVNIGSSITVSAGSTESRTLTPDTTGWLPFYMATVQFSTAPTTGAVSIKVLKR